MFVWIQLGQAVGSGARGRGGGGTGGSRRRLWLRVQWAWLQWQWLYPMLRLLSEQPLPDNGLGHRSLETLDERTNESVLSWVKLVCDCSLRWSKRGHLPICLSYSWQEVAEPPYSIFSQWNIKHVRRKTLWTWISSSQHCHQHDIDTVGLNLTRLIWP